MLNNLKTKLMQWMQGRYGSDLLSRYLFGLVVVLFILNIFIPYLNYGAIAIMVIIYYRMFSKNTRQRGLENYQFIILKNKIFKPFQIAKKRLFGDKTSKYYRCSHCKQIIRVPKGKGKIKITCPKCHATFIKKT